MFNRPLVRLDAGRMKTKKPGRSMKKLFLLCLSAMLITHFSLSQSLIQTYDFPTPEYVEKGEYVEFYLPGCKNFAEEGTPLLPVATGKILLPPGTGITRVEVRNINYHPDIEKVKVIPASRPHPISEPASDDYLALPVRSIYDSALPYPMEKAMFTGNFYLSGHSIAVININPLVYHPSENRVSPISSISLEVFYEPENRSQQASKMLNDDPSTLQRLQRLVDNPSMTGAYTYENRERSGECDLLIITGASWAGNFQNYIDFKKERGYLVAVEESETIYATYSGQDDQEKIRNCIIDYYQNYGIDYVLLGGDADPQSATDGIIPHRGLTAYDDRNIPADMYYACLDGNWNDDGDNKWGEPGEDDLFAELSIGRLCFDSQTELDNMLNKLILYQDAPVIEDLEKALMLGENLDNQPTWGGDSKDEVANGSTNFGHDTEGVPDYFEVTRLYDRDINYNKHDIFEVFNDQGTHMLNHLGHSNVTYNMKMNNSDLTTNNFSNDGISRGFVIGYSQGCYNGSFDNRGTNPNSYGGDCFAEQITALETAQVASIANSRYGWYSPGNTNGPSQFFDREFYDAIFGEGITGIGFANGDSKEDNVGYITSDQIGRWCAYELNVFGDPTMDIWTAVPTEIAVAAQPVITMGSTDYTVHTDAPHARIGLVQDGELIGRGTAGANGSLDLQLFGAINSFDTITLSIIAHNRVRYTQEIAVIQDQPYVTFSVAEFNDQTGNGDGKLDYGETIIASIEMKNIGDQPATGVTVTLESADNFIMVIDNMEIFGDFQPGESRMVNGAFSFTIDSLTPVHTASFDLTASDGSSNFFSSFLGEICAPELNFREYTINDQSGNDNGRLDPGETADLMITVVNSGNSEAFNVRGIISTACEFITINENGLLYGPLTGGDEFTRGFSITASGDCPHGTIAQFSLEITATGGIAVNDTLETFIGQPPVLVVDLDQNRNSGPAIYESVMNNGIGAEYFSTWPQDVDDYEAVFVCLGIFWNNHKLTHEEGDMLTDYLLAGGNLYLEGGSTWWYDYQTSVHPMFNIEGDFGTLGLNNLKGIGGTMTENMSFTYEGDSLYWDKLDPVEPAFLLLENDDPLQGVNVAFDEGSYRTIGSSIEFGGLTDGTSPSTKNELMMQYLDFFGILNSTVSVEEQDVFAGVTDFTISPNPVSDHFSITWQMREGSQVDISVHSLTGKLVSNLWSGTRPAGNHSINIECHGLFNSGVYVVTLKTKASVSSKKMVVAR